MMTSGMDENGRRFLIELYNQSRGDPAVQVSMYDIGEHIGLDRSGASYAAEELIGFGFVAVKTLSGGIGLTDQGVAEAHQLGCGATGPSGSGAAAASLGDDRVMKSATRESVEHVVAVLKTGVGEKSWDFESLAELMADLKTIDAQMMSSKPKTAIIRACFQSIESVLEKAGIGSESMAQVKRLLGR